MAAVEPAALAQLRGGGGRDDPVRTAVLPAEHVRHALDRGIGKRLPQEVDLRQARNLRHLGEAEDRAVVLLQHVGAVVEALDRRQVAVLVEDRRDLAEPRVERLAGEPLAGPARRAWRRFSNSCESSSGASSPTNSSSSVASSS